MTQVEDSHKKVFGNFTDIYYEPTITQNYVLDFSDNDFELIFLSLIGLILGAVFGSISTIFLLKLLALFVEQTIPFSISFVPIVYF